MHCAELLALGLLVSGCDSEEDLSAPTDLSRLGAWLAERSFEDWEGETAVRARDGGGGAQVFVSPQLVSSLAARRGEHPPGAAAVRVLYRDDLESVLGYAAAVKVEPGGWLWYEVFDQDPQAEPAVAQLAAPGCVGCHEDGQDYIRSTYPLP